MRKLILQVQATVDGFIGGTNGEMDWVLMNWSEDIIECVKNITASVDTILLGKNLAQGFIPHWTNSLNSANPEPGAAIFVNTPKVVFTKTLDKCEWDNTVLAKGDLVQEVLALKNQVGNDMIAYGGGQFVSSLIKEGLVDEFYVFINPVTIGQGMSVFKELPSYQKLQLKTSQQFNCGIVLLNYELAKD